MPTLLEHCQRLHETTAPQKWAALLQRGDCEAITAFFEEVDRKSQRILRIQAAMIARLQGTDRAQWELSQQTLMEINIGYFADVETFFVPLLSEEVGSELRNTLARVRASIQELDFDDSNDPNIQQVVDDAIFSIRDVLLGSDLSVECIDQTSEIMGMHSMTKKVPETLMDPNIRDIKGVRAMLAADYDL